MNEMDPGYKVYQYDLGDGCVWHRYSRYMTSKDEYQKYRLVLTIDNKPVNWDAGSLFRYLRDYFYQKYIREGVPPPVITDVFSYENARSATVSFRDEYSVAMVLASPHVDTSMASHCQSGMSIGALMTFRLHVPGAYREVQRQIKLRAAQGIDTTTTEAHGTANEPFPPWSNGIQLFQRDFYGKITSPTGAMDGSAVKVYVADDSVNAVIGNVMEKTHIYDRMEPIFWPPNMKLQDAPYSLKTSLCVVIDKVPITWSENHIWSNLQKLQVLEREMGYILPSMIGVTLREDPLYPNAAVIMCADESSRNRLLGLRVLYTHPDPQVASPNVLLMKYHIQVERGDIDRAENLKMELDQHPDFLMLTSYSLECVLPLKEEDLSRELEKEKHLLASENNADEKAEVTQRGASSTDTAISVYDQSSVGLAGGNTNSWSKQSEMFEQPFKWGLTSQEIEKEQSTVALYKENMKKGLQSAMDTEWTLLNAFGKQPDLVQIFDNGILPYYVVSRLDSDAYSKIPSCFKTVDSVFKSIEDTALRLHMPTEILLKKLDWRRRWPKGVQLSEIRDKFAYHSKKLGLLDEGEYPALLHEYSAFISHQTEAWTKQMDSMAECVKSVISSRGLEKPKEEQMSILDARISMMKKELEGSNSESQPLQFPSRGTRADVFDALLVTKFIMDLRERCTVILRQRPPHWSIDELKSYLEHYFQSFCMPDFKIVGIEYPTDTSAIVALQDEGDADRIYSLKQVSLPLSTSKYNVSSSLKPFMIVSRWIEPNPSAMLKKLIQPCVLQANLDPFPCPISTVVGFEEDLHAPSMSMIGKNLDDSSSIRHGIEHLDCFALGATTHAPLEKWIEPTIPEAPANTSGGDYSRLQSILGGEDSMSAAQPTTDDLIQQPQPQPQQQPQPQPQQQQTHEQLLEQQRQWQLFLSTPAGQMWQYQQQAMAMGSYNPHHMAQQQVAAVQSAAQAMNAQHFGGLTQTNGREQLVNGMVNNATMLASSVIDSMSQSGGATPPAQLDGSSNNVDEERSLRPKVSGPKKSFFGQSNVHDDSMLAMDVGDQSAIGLGYVGGTNKPAGRESMSGYERDRR
eukprot:GHVH01012936.1.p1 GENE.GHVH01012936.1~~GHVH01012936.1.p1  ORF type:complete len:1081 (-),score=170.31 GHVH01012936.1:111-3353(-)